MIAFAPTAPAATSRASSSRPAKTRPGRPLSNHLVAACTARGCLLPSTRALHNARKRRARRGPGRAGAAAARRAVLLFPRGRRASLFCRGDGVGARLCRELFLWSGCARLWGRERLLAVIGVVDRRCETTDRGGNASPLLPRRQIARPGAAAGLGRPPRCAALVRFPASRGAIRKKHAKARLSCGFRRARDLILQTAHWPRELHRRHLEWRRQAF